MTFTVVTLVALRKMKSDGKNYRVHDLRVALQVDPTAAARVGRKVAAHRAHKADRRVDLTVAPLASLIVPHQGMLTGGLIVGQTASHIVRRLGMPLVLNLTNMVQFLSLSERTNMLILVQVLIMCRNLLMQVLN